MEIGRLQLWTQEPATCPYHEPDQFTPRSPMLFLQNTIQYYPPLYSIVLNCVQYVGCLRDTMYQHPVQLHNYSSKNCLHLNI
jgi:hypothetical protein